MNISMNTARQNVLKDKKKLETISKNLEDHSYPKEDLASEIETELVNNSGITRVKIGENQENLLMLIAKSNISVITKQLISSISRSRIEEIFSQDTSGNTALMHAAIVNNIEFLEGINTDTLNKIITFKNNANKTAFMLAVQNNHKTFLEKLFEKRVDLSKMNLEESLLLAAECGHKDIVDFLVTKNVNIDIKNSDGDTPLIVANKKGHYEVVSLLRKQYPISRIFFTMVCIGRWIGEFSQSFPNESIKEFLKILSRFIENVSFILHYLSNTKLSFTVPLAKKIDQWRPHPIEDRCINPECEKYVIKLIYGESDNPSEISVKILQELPTTVTAESENNQTTPIRAHQNQTQPSPILSVNSHNDDNDSEHCIQQASEITEQSQENFSDFRQLNEASRPDDNSHLEVVEAEANVKLAQAELLIKKQMHKK